MRLTVYEPEDELINWVNKWQLEQKVEGQVSIPAIKELDAIMEQDDNDLALWLYQLKDRTKLQMDFVVIVCGADLEQIEKKFAMLYFHLEDHSAPLYVLTRQHLHLLLPPGDHVIHVPKHLRQNICTFVPLYRHAIVTTMGLETDYFKQDMVYQSSQRYKNHSTKVTICTNSPLFWSMEINKSVGI